MPVESLDRHIDSTPDVAGGKPRIAGRRITVQQIVVMHEHLGQSIEEICSEYELGPAEVHAALAYYFDNREAIERSIKDTQEFVEAFRKSSPSVLERKLKELRGE